MCMCDQPPKSLEIWNNLVKWGETQILVSCWLIGLEDSFWEGAQSSNYGSCLITVLVHNWCPPGNIHHIQEKKQKKHKTQNKTLLRLPQFFSAWSPCGPGWLLIPRDLSSTIQKLMLLTVYDFRTTASSPPFWNSQLVFCFFLRQKCSILITISDLMTPRPNWLSKVHHTVKLGKYTFTGSQNEVIFELEIPRTRHRTEAAYFHCVTDRFRANQMKAVKMEASYSKAGWFSPALKLISVRVIQGHFALCILDMHQRYSMSCSTNVKCECAKSMFANIHHQRVPIVYSFPSSTCLLESLSLPFLWCVKCPLNSQNNDIICCHS